MSATETAKIEDRRGFEALVSRLARDSWDDARTAAELLAVLDSGCEMALANLERRSAELTASLSREAALVEALEESRSVINRVPGSMFCDVPYEYKDALLAKIDAALKSTAA